MRRRAWLAAAVVVGLGWWSFQPKDHDAALEQTSPGLLGGWGSAVASSSGSQAAKDGGVRPLDRTAAQWQNWLFTQSSLRGTHLDGDWGTVGPRGLEPNRALRRRFDQLMSTVGEVTPAELRAMVQALAERDLGTDAAAVMGLWDRYAALSAAALSSRPDPAHPEQWLSVLREQQALRRQWLGPEWAKAFFQDDEAQLLATVKQIQETAPGSAEAPRQPWEAAPAGANPEQWQAKRREALGSEAADRLAALDKQQADWSDRISQARQTAQRLQAQAELSAPQRDAALQQWVTEHFSVQEQPRVRALLGL